MGTQLVEYLDAADQGWLGVGEAVGLWGATDCRSFVEVPAGYDNRRTNTKPSSDYPFAARTFANSMNASV
jgi:hypothetical protein